MTITVVYSRTHPDVSSLTGHTGSHLWFSRFSFLHLWFFSYFVIFILSFIFQLFTTFGFLSLQLSSLFLSSCANVFILFLCFQLSYLFVSFYIHLSFSLGFRLLFWAERISFCFYFLHLLLPLFLVLSFKGENCSCVHNLFLHFSYLS
jgi:hypothetical protein